MKRYLKHFLPISIAIAVLFIIYLILFIATGQFDTYFGNGSSGTGNNDTNVTTNTERLTDERVFDYADILTSSEEDELRKLIAQREQEIHCDIVLVIISDENYASDNAMMNFADDFYDNNKFGYDKPWGDGALYLDNWKNSSWVNHDTSYCWFSTCGRVETAYSSTMISDLIDDVNYYVNDDPVRGYEEYINSLSRTMAGKTFSLTPSNSSTIPLKAMPIISLVVTGVYLLIFLRRNVGSRTTTPTTYLINKKPEFPVYVDRFLTKHVTQRHIERSSSSGGGGHHISSGGHSHGGGGGRH